MDRELINKSERVKNVIELIISNRFPRKVNNYDLLYSCMEELRTIALLLLANPQTLNGLKVINNIVEYLYELEKKYDTMVGDIYNVHRGSKITHLTSVNGDLINIS